MEVEERIRRVHILLKVGKVAGIVGIVHSATAETSISEGLRSPIIGANSFPFFQKWPTILIRKFII